MDGWTSGRSSSSELPGFQQEELAEEGKWAWPEDGEGEGVWPPWNQEVHHSLDILFPVWLLLSTCNNTLGRGVSARSFLSFGMLNHFFCAG